MPESIVSRHIAKTFVEAAADFLANIPENHLRASHHDVYQKGSREIWIWLRHCYRRSYPDIDWTGGLVVQVSGKNYSYCSFKNQPRYNFRLRPGWTVERLTKLMSRVIFRIMQEEPLHDARERLCKRVEALPDGLGEWLTYQHQDLEDEFDKMDLTTVYKWEDILRKKGW